MTITQKKLSKIKKFIKEEKKKTTESNYMIDPKIRRALAGLYLELALPKMLSVMGYLEKEQSNKGGR